MVIIRGFDETLDAVKEFMVAIKGPLTTPVGGGIRSLNVALRQLLIYTSVSVLFDGSKAFPLQLKDLI